MSLEIKRGGEHPEFLKRKARFEELHEKLIERAILVIKPLNVLKKINEENLKGKGRVTKQSFPYLEIFDLSWTECYVELSGYRFRHQITIAFYPFLVESNQAIKSVDQLVRNSNPKDIACPGFVVIGGTEAKSIQDDWEKLEVKNISSFDPSTVFKITNRLGEIKTNFKEIKPSFGQALKEAFRNSALKK